MADILQFRNAPGEKRKLADIPQITTAHDASLQEQAWKRIQQKDAFYGDAMPWPKTHTQIRFRPGEVTGWIGPNRDGKSLLLGYLAAHWALQENQVLVASLEMKVDIQLKRLSRQFLCTDSPSQQAFEMLLVRLFHLNFLDFVGHLSPHAVLKLVTDAAQRFRHIVIDNLTLIVPPGRNTDEHSSVFVRGLVEIARETNSHIHLVGHVRKPDDERMLNRYDWRGTGACPDMVHNVIVIQANEKKRREFDCGQFKRAEEADVFMTVDKQRNGEFHGLLKFWWRPKSLRLVEYGTDPEPAPLDPFDVSMWEE